jgi:hypothetical protein
MVYRVTNSKSTQARLGPLALLLLSLKKLRKLFDFAAQVHQVG